MALTFRCRREFDSRAIILVTWLVWRCREILSVCFRVGQSKYLVATVAGVADFLE
jgi:hypothetical protein